MRRYEAHDLRSDPLRAELINGIVYIMTPAHFESHGATDSLLQTWLGVYASYAPRVKHAINATVKLNCRDTVQPDGLLWDMRGSQARLNADDYLEGAPELIVETSASSASYDSREKLESYLRAGVCEYIIWRTLDCELDWFALQNGEYVRLPLDDQGVIRSRHFPGLWLNVRAVLVENRKEVLRTLDGGMSAGGLK